MRLAHALLVASLALGAGCGGGSEPAKAPEPEPAATPAPAPAPAPAAEPEPAAAPASAGPDVAEGGRLYATYCASCHGAKGGGDGPAAAGLNPKPAHHNDAAYMDTLTDEHIFKVIKFGGASVGKSPLMAPWGSTFTDDQIHDLVAFVRTLSHPKQ